MGFVLNDEGEYPWVVGFDPAANNFETLIYTDALRNFIKTWAVR